jgi:1-acyl-sn-glycerol-3-phosphate acyltransferase
LWDVVFIISRMPDAICVIKESILNNLFLGGGSRLSGYISNAGTSSMVRAASESLQRGGQLLLFPEGTRTHVNARWVNPLKGGCALIAKRAGVPIYPVFIRSDTRYLQKGWPLWRRPVFPIHMSLELGEPLLPIDGETAHDLNERLQAVYEQELSRPHPLRRQIVP